MKKFLPYFSILFLVSSSLYSQKLDSLTIYQDEIKKYIYADRDKVSNLANAFSNYASKLRIDSIICTANYYQIMLGTVSNDSTRIEKYYPTIKDCQPKHVGISTNAYGGFFLNRGDFEKAKAIFRRNWNLKNIPIDNLIVSYANYALACNNQGLQDSNMYYLLKADALAAKNKIDDKTAMILSNYLLVGYYNLSDYKNAIKKGSIAVEAAKKANYMALVPDIYNNIIGSHIGLYDFKNARILLDSMKQYLSYNPPMEANYLMNFAEINKQDNKINEAKENLISAISILDKNGNNPFFLRNAINDLISLKFLTNDYTNYTQYRDLAYNKCSSVLTISDTLRYNKAGLIEQVAKYNKLLADTLIGHFYKYENYFENEEKVKLNELTKKYDTEKKEEENLVLAEKNKSQRNYLYGALFGLALISLLSYRLMNQRNKQKQLNSQLTQSRDKISLLNSELNHRVKNNLAFMTSLLEMQGRRTPNEEAKEILKESESRLKTLSLVHANLYQNNQNTQINLKHYLSEITNHLSQYFSIPNKDLQIITDFIDHSCDAEDAMRLGLIVNELVTNSVKHAFHEVENPAIDITTSKNEDGKVVLSYRDNGPGVTVNAGSTANKDISLGVKLIGLLKEQLGERYLIV